MTAPMDSTTTSDAPEPSGLTVDGIPVPLSIEAAGGAAIEAYVLAHRAAASQALPTVPSTDSEGAPS